MANKNKENKHLKHAAERSQPSIKGRPEGLNSSLYTRWILCGILLITFLSYLPSIKNGLLITWDDQAYVTHNDLVKSLSPANIIRIFKEDKGLYANYHPLTTLSLAINYHFSQLSATGYHLTNLLIHLLNTALVFIFIYLLSGNEISLKNTLSNKNPIHIAAVVSLLFGIHPIHVESVAWVSERKDVLYTFFFLLSGIAYLRYIKNREIKFYLIAILLFLFSLLSKAMAASLPLVLLLIDYYKGRKWDKKILLEKLPFLALAVLLGIYAMHIQQQAVATANTPFMLRFFHASYGFAVYIGKIIWPYSLSAFYPYPYALSNGSWVTNTIPSIFYLTLVLSVVVLVVTAIIYFRKTPLSKAIVFGVLFYAVTVALVLQFIQVGRAIMADRYAYIPSIGLFFIVGEGLSLLYNKINRTVAVVLFLGYGAVLFYLNLERTKVWKNDETLWTDVLKKYPNDNRASLAVSNLADYYITEKRLNDALHVYQSLTSPDANTCFSIATLYEQIGDMDKADAFYRKTLELNSNHYKAINNYGLLLLNRKDYTTALQYFRKASDLRPAKAEAPADYDRNIWYNMGVAFYGLNKNDSALMMYNKVLEANPNDASTLNNYGVILFGNKDYAEAIKYFKHAAGAKPDFADAFSNQGACYQLLNDYKNAIPNYEKALSINPRNAGVMNNLSKIYAGLGDREKESYYQKKMQEANAANVR